MVLSSLRLCVRADCKLHSALSSIPSRSATLPEEVETSTAKIFMRTRNLLDRKVALKIPRPNHGVMPAWSHENQGTMLSLAAGSSRMISL